jgi:hypothetical protein
MAAKVKLELRACQPYDRVSPLPKQRRGCLAGNVSSGKIILTGKKIYVLKECGGDRLVSS